MRFGTRTELKRKWPPQGHRPKAPIRIGYSFAYLYVALCPFSGEVFAMSLPYMNKECFPLLVQQWQETLTEPTLLLADRASTHQASLLKDTAVTLQHLPTACPELNPVERFFEELRKQMANRVFASLQQAEASVIKAVKGFLEDPQKVVALTNYQYLTTSYQI
jgi:hypothetical protein